MGITSAYECFGKQISSKIETTILIHDATKHVFTINTTFLAQRHTWSSHVSHGLGHGEPREEAIMRMRTQFLYYYAKITMEYSTGTLISGVTDEN